MSIRLKFLIIVLTFLQFKAQLQNGAENASEKNMNESDESEIRDRESVSVNFYPYSPNARSGRQKQKHARSPKVSYDHEKIMQSTKRERERSRFPVRS